MCLTFSLGYKSTAREKEVGGGDSVGGCRVGSGGRKIKRRDSEVNTFKGRNVNHKAVWNYVWTWMLLNRGIPRRQLWVALHTRDTHTQLEASKACE